MSRKSIFKLGLVVIFGIVALLLVAYANNLSSSDAIIKSGEPAYILKTTDGWASWTKVLDTGQSFKNAALQDLSCSTAADCLALQPAGILITTNGGQEWQTGGSLTDLQRVRCSSPTDCFGYRTKYGLDAYSTHDGGKNWQSLSTANLKSAYRTLFTGVSCPSSSSCFMSGQAGMMVSTRDGGQNWKETFIYLKQDLIDVSCPTETYCVGVGFNDVNTKGYASVIVTEDGGANWTVNNTSLVNSFRSVACPTTTSCYASGAFDNDYKNGQILYSGDGGKTWTIKKGGSYVSRFSCPSQNTCYAVANQNQLLKTTDGGNTWTAVSPEVADNRQLGSLDCPTGNTCYVLSNVSINP